MTSRHPAPTRARSGKVTLSDVLHDQVQDSLLTADRTLFFASLFDITVGVAYLAILLIVLLSGDLRGNVDVVGIGAFLNVLHVFLPVMALAIPTYYARTNRTTPRFSGVERLARTVAALGVLSAGIDAVSLVYRVYAIIRCSSDAPLFTDEATCNELLSFNITTSILIALWIVDDLVIAFMAYLISTYLAQASTLAMSKNQVASLDKILLPSITAPASRLKRHAQRKKKFVSVQQDLESAYATPHKKKLVSYIKMLAVFDLLLIVPYVALVVVVTTQASSNNLLFFFGLMSFVHFPFDAALFRSAIAYSRGTVVLFRSIAVVMLALDGVSLALRVVSLLSCGGSPHGHHFILDAYDCSRGIVYGGTIATCILLFVFIIDDIGFIFGLFSIEASIGTSVLLAGIVNEKTPAERDIDDDSDGDEDGVDRDETTAAEPPLSLKTLPSGAQPPPPPPNGGGGGGGVLNSDREWSDYSARIQDGLLHPRGSLVYRQ
jgi:hypothetical protein